MTTHLSAPVAGSLPPAPDAKIAMGWMHTARFLTTAAQLHHLPPIDVPEIAFVGRSNAGKSTCINTLTQQKQLAFASKKPGRTQHINLFALGKQGVTDAVLADLPGYGYAAVSRSDKLRWQQVMVNYLVSRPGLTGIVLLCDPRLGLTELDEALLEAVRPRVEEGLKFLIVLTKADKLTRSEQAKVLSITRLQAGGGEVKMFSALKKQGVDEVAQLLWQWAHPVRPQGTEPAAEGGAQPLPASPQAANIYLSGRRLHELDVQAGQFFNFRFLAPGLWWHGHPFSTSSGVFTNAAGLPTMRITVRNLGKGTAELIKVRPGTQVLFAGPYGIFSDRARTTDHLILMGSGVGIAPIRALLDQTTVIPGQGLVVLRASSPAELYLFDEFRTICAKRGLRLVTLVGHRGTHPTTGLSWSSAEYSTLRLRELAPWAADADVFICGPLRWTEDAQAEAIACGVPQTQIHAERFAQ